MGWYTIQNLRARFCREIDLDGLRAILCRLFFKMAEVHRALWDSLTVIYLFSHINVKQSCVILKIPINRCYFLNTLQKHDANNALNL